MILSFTLTITWKLHPILLRYASSLTSFNKLPPFINLIIPLPHIIAAQSVRFFFYWKILIRFKENIIYLSISTIECQPQHLVALGILIILVKKHHQFYFVAFNFLWSMILNYPFRLILICVFRHSLQSLNWTLIESRHHFDYRMLK